MHTLFSIGESVRVTDGPFASEQVTIRTLDPAQTVAGVTVMLSGQAVDTSLPLGAAAIPATGNLIHLLKTDPSATVRVAAIDALAAVGADAARTAPIGAATSERSHRVQQAVFGGPSVEDAPLCAAIAPLLDHDSAATQHHAVRAITKLGACAQPVLPKLRALLEGGPIHRGTHPGLGSVSPGPHRGPWRWCRCGPPVGCPGAVAPAAGADGARGAGAGPAA